MKLFATVRIDEEKNAGYLVRAFFKAYKAENILCLSGDEAFIRIDLENTEQEKIDFLAEAIAHCKIINLRHGEVPADMQNESDEEENVIEESKEVTEATEKTPEQKEFEEKLVQIATYSSSYEEFKERLLAGMRMSANLKRIFSHLVEAAEETKVISWKNVMKNYERNYSEPISSQRCNLQAKVKSITGLNVLECISAVANHKNDCYTAEKNVDDGKSSTEQISNEDDSQVVNGQTKNEECSEASPQDKKEMTQQGIVNEKRENGIESLLSIIDKTQSLSERVEAVMSEMELPENQPQKVEIQKMVERLITQPVIDFSQENVETRMIFANMVNVFMKNHGRKAYIKAKEFLQELQAIILTDEELEQFKIKI